MSCENSSHVDAVAQQVANGHQPEIERHRRELLCGNVARDEAAQLLTQLIGRQAWSYGDGE